MREVGDLLKESTANKINIKNTWTSTLIDDFMDVNRFKESATDSTNFQHASIVLDGCVKVYSTRVDSVVDEADKLMESVGRVNEAGRALAKDRSHPTIAAPDSLLLKRRPVSLDDEMLEHLARESKEGDTRGVLMHLLKWNDPFGLALARSPAYPSTSPAPSPPPTTPVDRARGLALAASLAAPHHKHISPMFARFTPDASLEDLAFPTYAYHLSYDHEVVWQPPVGAEGGAELGAAEVGSGDIDPGAEPDWGHPADINTDWDRPAALPAARLSLSPFGYIQGWAGPAHWKMQARTRRRPREKTRERKKAAIDFLSAPRIPVDLLFEKDPRIVFTPQQISERRQDAHMLPPDHSVSIDQLYQLFICQGKFCSGATHLLPKQESDRLPEAVPADLFDGAGGPDDWPLAAPEDEPLPEPLGPESRPAHPKEPSLLSRRLLQSTLRRGRQHDIVQVKQQLWHQIEQGETQVQEIYSAVQQTQQEAQVSAQFCFVSLLHLANEKNLQISSPHLAALSSLADLVVEQ